MSTKKRRLLVVVFLIMLFMVWVMGQYDYSRLVAGKRPMFAWHQSYLEDGGSIEYDGFGYTVSELHELRWGIELEPEVEPGSTNRVTPFRVGQTLNYWTPFVSRENTWLTFETNEFDLKHTRQR